MEPYLIKNKVCGICFGIYRANNSTFAQASIDVMDGVLSAGIDIMIVNTA